MNSKCFMISNQDRPRELFRSLFVGCNRTARSSRSEEMSLILVLTCVHSITHARHGGRWSGLLEHCHILWCHGSWFGLGHWGPGRQQLLRDVGGEQGSHDPAELHPRRHMRISREPGRRTGIYNYFRRSVGHAPDRFNGARWSRAVRKDHGERNGRRARMARPCDKVQPSGVYVSFTSWRYRWFGSIRYRYGEMDDGRRHR